MALLNAPDLGWVEAARDILHAHSAAVELQHGLPLQEGCCRDVHVEGETRLAACGPQTLVVLRYPVHTCTIPQQGLVEAETAWHPAGQRLILCNGLRPSWPWT